jgi:hypothetical protein
MSQARQRLGMLEPLGARFPPMVFNPNDAAKALSNLKMISDRLKENHAKRKKGIPSQARRRESSKSRVCGDIALCFRAAARMELDFRLRGNDG